jgi:hypothetical protein
MKKNNAAENQRNRDGLMNGKKKEVRAEEAQNSPSV